MYIVSLKSNIMRIIISLLTCFSFSLLSCDSPNFRPKPKFEIVEAVHCEYEGLLDLGLKVKGKVHNYGAAGTHNITFKMYVGYYNRKTNRGYQPSWDEEYSQTKAIFLNEGETKTVSQIFKQIDILDSGLRCSIDIK